MTLLPSKPVYSCCKKCDDCVGKSECLTYRRDIKSKIEDIDDRVTVIESFVDDSSNLYAHNTFVYEYADSADGKRIVSLQYIRTGEKSGIISGSVYSEGVTNNDMWVAVPVSTLMATLGITLNTTTEYTTGHCQCIDGLVNAVDASKNGYGTYCRYYYGDIRFGRIYTTSGNIGDWQMTSANGLLFTFSDVYVIEV